jgi:DNA modification methylase
LGDCIEVIKGIPDESIHYSIFSPPFLNLFVYSNSLLDMGNSKNDKEFYTHFSYLIPELYRVLKSGRLISIHCSIIPMTLQHDGVMGLKDLPGMIVKLFENFGFIYHSKVMIWKDPLLQAVRTKMLSLAHKQISKDSSRCAQGFADEILTFRKPGENTEPVAHGRGFENYIGEKQEPKKDKNDNPKINKYSHEVWQRYASPVWMDISQSDTLNFRAARDQADERHICPLQLQVIARCLELWTNEGDIVLSPFAGIGSEGYESLRKQRKFIGIELKESYYKSAIKNLNNAKNKQKGLL